MPSGREHTRPDSLQSPDGLFALWSDTLQGLVEVRRAGPMLLLALPLLASQHVYSAHPIEADLIAIGMLAGFVLTGPFAWRALIGRDAVGLPWTLRLLGYGAVGLLPLFGGFAMTTAVELQPSFLVSALNAGVAGALFLVGGWGLGRDIELQRGLDEALARAEALAKQAEAAELLAIRAHLDPHFLFNTLGAIAEWCVVDGEKAEQAILTLAAVLRRVLGGIRSHGDAWPLSEELAVVKGVLDLHRVRDPEWFDIDWHTDPDLPDGLTVPTLVLLPIVENAVKHGPAAGHRGTISVSVGGLEGALRIELVNPGPLGDPRAGSEGLRLVRERLALVHGDAASFVLEPLAAHRDAEGPHTRAVVVLPGRPGVENSV